MRIGSAAALAGFIAAQPAMRDLLAVVASLDLPVAWIGAEFVRNPVWNALHGRAPDIAGLLDVGVVFFDPVETGRERDRRSRPPSLRSAPACPGRRATRPACNCATPTRPTAIRPMP